MTPERYQQVGRLYHAALELDPDRRAAFLSEASGADEELRREVESLLEAHDQVGPYFAAPALELAAGLLVRQQNDSLVGLLLSHYRILSLIGAGGMGEVYLAEDMQLGRKVALKLLPRGFTQDHDRVSLFEREARTSSALNHPSIVTIFEVGHVDGRHFIATEYIDGRTLRKHLGTGSQLELCEVLDIVLPIANALASAHESGIVHRDIKPENVMLRRDGVVKVLDFGLAKLIKAQTPAGDDRISGMEIPGVVGTPRYMSPEQVRGEEVDGRSDIFSLGVVLYEMLTARAPFEGATWSELSADILHRDPGPLARYVRGVPAELERIVDKALARERGERYQTCKDLLIDLRNLRLEIDVTARLKRSAPLDSNALKAPRNEPKQRSVSEAPSEEIGRRPAELKAIVPKNTAAYRTAELIKRNKRGAVAAALVAVLIALVASGLWLSPRLGTNAGREVDALAVLPLENLSGDPEQDYFADGMTETLITELGRIGALRVISRPSVMMYKGTRTPLPEIARELNVDAVVVGSVLRSGDRVRVTTQLIEAATERQRLSKSYERDGRDVLELQREVAHAITREIQSTIRPVEQARLANPRQVDLKAYEDYLQGRYFFWNRRTEEDLRKAIEYFEGAIQVDPGFALAYSGLADSYNLLGTVMVGTLPPTEARRRAEEAARKALELESGLAEAHVALGYVKHYNWNWAEAEQEFRRAIELNPNDANPHIQYAHYLSSRSRPDEAIAEANRAQQSDPLSLTIRAQKGFILGNARRLDEAIDHLRRVIAMDPNHYAAHWMLGHTYAANGQLDEAIAASERAAALSGRAPGALGILAMAYGLAGRYDEANRVLNELLDLDRRRYVTPAALVCAYLGMGNKDQAFAWLEKAYQERSNYMAYLQVWPANDPLRSDPRFDDLLRRIGL